MFIPSTHIDAVEASAAFRCRVRGSPGSFTCRRQRSNASYWVTDSVTKGWANAGQETQTNSIGNGTAGRSVHQAPQRLAVSSPHGLTRQKCRRCFSAALHDRQTTSMYRRWDLTQTTCDFFAFNQVTTSWRGATTISPPCPSGEPAIIRQLFEPSSKRRWRLLSHTRVAQFPRLLFCCNSSL
jgi:hypothetical protein